MTRKARRTFTPEFKEQIVKLYQGGKRRVDICREYEISDSILNRWIKQYTSTKSFKEADNRTDEENRMIKLEKELKQLRMENDILKQAALIMGRK